MKRGLFKVTPEELVLVLKLPLDTEIDSAVWDPIDRTIVLSVLHPELPEVYPRQLGPFVKTKTVWK
jgi:hypothetical protein